MREQCLTFCYIGVGLCARKVTIEDGRIVDVEMDTESGLPTEWCRAARGRSILEINTHPERLKYPVIRDGAKGSGKWKRITWDEALDTIAGKFGDLKKKFGPECVALGLGEPKGMEFHVAQRFASAFETPNVATPGCV
ncbi:MAG: molybdopterin-dependent oxidoreductase, partial [Dehalococcoidia bacterium]|nr:molybdopterin-dependent oxidoreductase [Dehalococcoidia bacterium]